MLRTMIRLPDGSELFSGVDLHDVIQSVKLTECVNKDKELTLGSVCANMLEVDLQTPNGGLEITAGDEVTVYKTDETGALYLLGLYSLAEPKRVSANTLQITAYDRVSWLDKDLTGWLAGLNGWPYSLITFAGMVCRACGLALVNSSIPNGDYQVQAFTAQEITGRKLMQWVGEAAGRFCRATPEGKIEFAWYEPSGVELTPDDDRFYFQNGLSYEDYSVVPIEKVQIKLVQDDVGVVWPDEPGEKNTYTISGNYLLTTTSTHTLLPVVQTLYEQMKTVTYTPCKVQLPAGVDVHAGHTVKITDRNGKSFTSFVMTKTQKEQLDTLECTGSHRRDSTTVVNNQTYEALSGKLLQMQQSIEGFSVAASEIQGKAVYSTVEEFYSSASPTTLVGGVWGEKSPEWEAGRYIWRRSKVTRGDGAVTYTPSETGVCIAGNTGADGIPGKDGADGISTYFYVKYSGKANGVPMTDIPTDTTKYMGVCSTTAAEAPMDPSVYEWSQCRGDDGQQGIQGEKGEKGDKGDTGVQGAKGDNGVGVETITNYYLATASASGVTTSTSGWTTTVQSVSASKKYLWNYEKVTYTDGSTSNTAPCIIGAYGDKGDKGEKGDTGAQGPQGEKGDTGTAGDKGDKGDTGATGATGNGIKSITEHYAISTSATTAPTSWQSTVPTLTATNKYLWNYETITYTNGTTVDTLKRVIGVHGDKGATGAQGIQGEKGDKGDTGATGAAGKAALTAVRGFSSRYTVGSSINTGWSGTLNRVPVVGETFSTICAGRYMTIFSVTAVSGNSTTVKSIYEYDIKGATGAQGAKGDKGDQGIQGPTGADGRTQYLHIKYSDDGETFTTNNGEELGAWIGTLVDFNENDSTTFGDYTWKKFTEDVDEELGNLDQGIRSVQESISKLVVDDDSVRASVSNLEKIVNSTTEEILETKAQIASVNLQSSQLEVKIEQIANDGVKKVSNTTGTFDADGLMIDSTNSPTKTQVTPDGMTVYKKSYDGTSAVLSATSDGVDATNLHAKTYLIIGGRSRFENYGSGRTGCFWIGG